MKYRNQTGVCRTHRHPRHGFTLIETVIVIAALTLIGTMSAAVLFAMIQQQSATSVQLLNGNNLDRLSNRFRADVHAARSAINDRESALTLELNDSVSVTYDRHEANTIRRTISENGKVRQDDFDVQDQFELRFTTVDDNESRLIQLSIIPPDLSDPKVAVDSPKHPVSRVGHQTLAELGRDHRWEGAGRGE